MGAGDTTHDVQPGSWLLSLPEEVLGMIVGALVVQPSDNDDERSYGNCLVHGLLALSLSCKAMQPVVDRYVKVLRHPRQQQQQQQEEESGGHAALERRWPHAAEAWATCTDQAAALLASRTQLGSLAIELDVFGCHHEAFDLRNLVTSSWARCCSG